MPESEILAKNIAKIRKQMKETQEEFAAHCDIASGTLNLMENQKTDPRLSSIQKVASYIGCTVPELLSKEENISGQVHIEK
jgi:transcriptional regulator with XRE-family HTH domain